MDIPVILVSDFEEKPPITTKYINGDNVLDLETVYVNVNSLRAHPGRGRLEEVTGSTASPNFRLKECKKEFLNTFWDCASNLCDYFADFLSHDTAAMQSVWFHMLNELQEAAILPHQFWIGVVPCCKHSVNFMADLEKCRKVILETITPMAKYRGAPICPDGYLFTALAPNAGTPGSLKSGLKPWQQFLYKDSPGFAVPPGDRVYLNATHQSPDQAMFDVHIPRGGLALIDRHTKRLKAIEERMSREGQDAQEEASAPAVFQQNALDLEHISTYTSIDGRRILTHPMHPNPGSSRAPQHNPERADPSHILTNPDTHALNEYIGHHKGSDIYHHPDDDGKHPMLSLGAPAAMQNGASQPKIDTTAYFDMYDEWTVETSE